jgi:hypothetical protein
MEELFKRGRFYLWDLVRKSRGLPDVGTNVFVAALAGDRCSAIAADIG